MRKRKKGKKFSRTSNQRKALLRSLVRSLFLQEKMKTTLAKAKAASQLAERLITKAKKGNLASRRYLLGFLNASTARKLAQEIAPSFQERKGGYTRIVKLGPRRSDGARMAIIELMK